MRLPVHGAAPYQAACPDCPGARLGVLQDLIGETKHACAFETVMIDARDFVPTTWTERHAFGLVRRGVLIRQRLDDAGRATAIDAAGPGCMFPIEHREEGKTSISCDYAATDLIVCLCPTQLLDDVLDDSRRAGRDLLSLQLDAMERVERLTQARGAATVRERVATLLIVLSETLSPPRTREQLPSGLQQRDMSKLLGVRHETFCRALKTLEDEGAIQRTGDGLLITDRARLS
ncbi:MAG: Crp/Fnr family transcriptional regulator [Sandaracinaceae bacterium]|nr:Crp/Fnr family transcriptional regulator [Sandaracinaceae bacterium]